MMEALAWLIVGLLIQFVIMARITEPMRKEDWQRGATPKCRT
jgi:hypothetical protein